MRWYSYQLLSRAGAQDRQPDNDSVSFARPIAKAVRPNDSRQRQIIFLQSQNVALDSLADIGDGFLARPSLRNKTGQTEAFGNSPWAMLA